MAGTGVYKEPLNHKKYRGKITGKKKPHKAEIFWGDRWGSNPRQPESQSGTLPTELRSPLHKDETIASPFRFCKSALQ